MEKEKRAGIVKMALAIAAMGIVAVGAWWYLRPVPRHYQVFSISAHTWILPIVGNTVYGTSAHWRLQNSQGEIRIRVSGGQIRRIHSYLGDSCAAQAGNAAHWQWVAHSHHHEARILFGQCRVDLRAVQATCAGSLGSPFGIGSRSRFWSSPRVSRAVEG